MFFQVKGTAVGLHVVVVNSTVVQYRGEVEEASFESMVFLVEGMLDPDDPARRAAHRSWTSALPALWSLHATARSLLCGAALSARNLMRPDQLPWTAGRRRRDISLTLRWMTPLCCESFP